MQTSETFLVVGWGLAGMAVARQFELRGTPFEVISDRSTSASRVAAGVYNPIVLRRYNLAWEAAYSMPLADSFYQALSDDLGIEVDVPLPLYRRMASVEEQNGWYTAMDKPGLMPFMHPEIVHYKNPGLDLPYGVGPVLNTGWVRTEELLDRYAAVLSERGLFHTESWSDDHWDNERKTWHGRAYRGVVLATGFGIAQSRYFGYLPVQGTKGELLTIHAPGLGEEHIVKSGVFLLPLGNDYYRVGSTYSWDDPTDTPTEQARIKLEKDLEALLLIPYQVVDHRAGLRPTVPDRRPLVGVHPNYPSLSVINGMGSRGVVMAPSAAKALVTHLIDNEPLAEEIDIKRYARFLASSGL